MTIEACYDDENVNEKQLGIKNDDGDWNMNGSPRRIIRFDKEKLCLLAQVFDGSQSLRDAKLSAIQLRDELDILRTLNNVKTTVSNLNNKFIVTEMWHEANSQKAGDITRNVHFAYDGFDRIYSGPHIGVGNSLFKSSRSICKLNSDYDNIDLLKVDFDYSQRINYSPAKEHDEYMKAITENSWSGKVINDYRIVARKMLNLGGERTLIAAIIPPKTTHINGLLGVDFQDENDLVLAEAMFSSLPFDYFVRTLNKSNLQLNIVAKLPYVTSKYDSALRIRALMLNCLSDEYKQLWERLYREDYCIDKWAKADKRLSDVKFKDLKCNLTFETSCRTDYERRQMLVEIDVLTAMALGMSLYQLQTIYKIQFPVLQSYEDDTWYDQNGRIVFTNNRSLTGVGFPRLEWEKIKNAQEGVFSQIIEDDTMPGGSIMRKIEYIAPFDRCDREKDYEEVWHNFEKRFII